MSIILCPHCNGYGSSLKDTGNPNAPCSRCNGAGAVRVPTQNEMRPVTLLEAFELFNIKPTENKEG